MGRTLYNVGDKVIVREDLQEDEDYKMDNGSSDCATLHMTTFRGRVVTISKSTEFGYEIFEDNERWNWTDEMFVLESNLITKFRLDKIRGE